LEKPRSALSGVFLCVREPYAMIKSWINHRKRKRGNGVSGSVRRGGKRLHFAAWLAVVLAAVSALVSAPLVGGVRSVSEVSGLIAFARADGVYVMPADGSRVRAIRRGGIASHVLGHVRRPEDRVQRVPLQRPRHSGS
jgi:hypothetical protein